MSEEYSRGGFLEFLKGLPPDQPFCDDDKCPIASWMHIDNGRALEEDFDLAIALDDYVWSELTPNETIDIINRLEAGDYERIDYDDLPF